MKAEEIRSKALCADTTEQAVATALEILQEIAAQLAELNMALKTRKQTHLPPGIWKR